MHPVLSIDIHEMIKSFSPSKSVFSSFSAGRRSSFLLYIQPGAAVWLTGVHHHSTPIPNLSWAFNTQALVLAYIS